MAPVMFQQTIEVETQCHFTPFATSRQTINLQFSFLPISHTRARIGLEMPFKMVSNVVFIGPAIVGKLSEFPLLFKLRQKLQHIINIA
jgi:hypothetical protein